MEYCVYIHTAPDGRVYVGITSQKPEARWQGGNGYKNNSYFTRAIKKYGWENFKHEILFEGLTVDEAKTKEIDLIAEYKSNVRKYGFNISSGGESKKGTTISDWQKQRISQASKGRIVSGETREKLSRSSKRAWENPEFIQYMREINSGKNNKMYGRKMTDEDKQKRGAKSVVQFDKAGNKIAEYISIHEASNKTGICRDSIQKCCRGIFKTAGGFIWDFKK